MQLKKPNQGNNTSRTRPRAQPSRIRGPLAAATCSLLASTISAAETNTENNWQIDSALLIYAETDRVQLVEPVLRIRKEIDDDEFFGVRLVLDALTGASPNGAVPTDSPQTFTSPSGKKTYQTTAGETPLDATFRDARVAVSAEWEKPLSARLRGIFGGNFSKEYDYTSLGISASLSQDINQRNTTLTAAISANIDTIEPVGDAPIGLGDTPIYPALKPTDGGSKDKTVNELLLGITQVVNRRTLMQFNYSYGQSKGYLNDPYKILSVLENDSSGNLRTTASPYVFEKRPDSRTYQNVYWKGIHQLQNTDVITVSYRYLWDGWSIRSHTLDTRYRYELEHGAYLQPHLRYYTQSAADFYRQTLTDGEVQNLDYASADYRLGDMTTQTLGLKYGREFDSGAEWNLRVEFIQQTGKTRTTDAIGKLSGRKLFPDNDAYLVQAGITTSTDGIMKFIASVFRKFRD
jgi:hypothetical protein